MKRETLTHNLHRVLKRIQRLFLPVEIESVFIHGSYLRGKEHPGDLDVFALLTARREWSQWHESFQSLIECRDVVWQCYQQGMSVSDAISGPLAEEIDRRGIPREWISKMSWSEILGRTSPYIPFSLSWDRVTVKSLTEGMRGVAIQLVGEEPERIVGRLYLCQELPVFKAWEAQSPDQVVLQPTPKEFQTYLRLENGRLRGEVKYAHLVERLGTSLVRQGVDQISEKERALLALRVLDNTPKCDASEEQLRSEMRRFRIPEHRVYTLKRRGLGTRFKLPESEEQELQLRKKIEEWKAKDAAENRILALAKKIIPKNEATRIDCRVINLENGLVTVTVEKPDKLTKEEFKKIWKRRSFDIDELFEDVCADKSCTFANVPIDHMSMSELMKVLMGKQNGP